MGLGCAEPAHDDHRVAEEDDVVVAKLRAILDASAVDERATRDRVGDQEDTGSSHGERGVIGRHRSVFDAQFTGLVTSDVDDLLAEGEQSGRRSVFQRQVPAGNRGGLAMASGSVAGGQ